MPGAVPRPFTARIIPLLPSVVLQQSAFQGAQHTPKLWDQVTQYQSWQQRRNVFVASSQVLSPISFLLQCSRAWVGGTGWSVCVCREGGLQQKVFPAAHPPQPEKPLPQLTLAVDVAFTTRGPDEVTVGITELMNSLCRCPRAKCALPGSFPPRWAAWDDGAPMAPHSATQPCLAQAALWGER